MNICAEMHKRAKVCETIAEDKTQEFPVGESNEKEIDEQDAKECLEKSKVWREAEAIVRVSSAEQSPPAK